ncbi:hypothetical protein L7F22_015420 [Adiantum nelumboides]|nr:hypothetical protein [Adiantum nelumboides]
MEHRRLVGEATNLMLNFAKDPKLAKCMSETAFQDVHAQWKATTTSPSKPDSKKQYSEKELEEEINARLARILGAQKQGNKHDRKRKKSTDFPGYLGSQSTFDKAKKHKKRAAVPSSSSSSDSSSESSKEERRSKKRSKKHRHGKGKRKTRKSKSRRVDDCSTDDTSTDSSDSEDVHFYANKKNFYKANQYDFLEDKSKKVREFKEGGQSIKFETFSGYKDASKALSFIQQFDIAFAGGRYLEHSKTRRATSYLKGNARTWWSTLLLNKTAPVKEVLHADILSEIEDKLAERGAIMHLEERVSEAEYTQDFLLQMQQRKHVISQKLVQELNSLEEDIQEVKRWHALLMKNRWNEGFRNKSIKLAESFTSGADGSKLLSDYLVGNEDVVGSNNSRDGLSGRRQELVVTKSAQLSKSFTQLREAYLSVINIKSGIGLMSGMSKQSKQRSEHLEKLGLVKLLDDMSSSQAERQSGGRLGSFFDDFCLFMKHSKFDVRATLQYGDILNTKNMVCSLNFDCDDEYFATAGVSRRIKIFDCNALLEGSNEVHYPVIEMGSRRKLSCVCWNKFRKNLLSSSDLEGFIQLWDVTTGQTSMELKEHSKCAWSVDFSHFDSSRLASGSDDCFVKLWSTNQLLVFLCPQGISTGTIKTKANVCSVQFSSNHSHILAFGSADSQVYFHDLRYLRIPICILSGHQKAVSFVRFADNSSIVSASTDNTLKLWDLTRASTITRGCGTGFGSKVECAVTYTGHSNLKNFVGLSVAEQGYIACGSETNEVFVYHKSLPKPMLSHKFRSADPISGEEVEDHGDQFVSSVCWRNRSPVLVIANSVGNIQVLEMI